VVKAEVKVAIFRAMLREHKTVNIGVCPSLRGEGPPLQLPEFLWKEYGLSEDPPEEGQEPNVIRFEYGYEHRLCRELFVETLGIRSTLKFAESGWHPTFVPWNMIIEFYSLDVDDDPCVIMLSVNRQFLQPIEATSPPDGAPPPEPTSPVGRRPSHLKLVK